jgi:hypothetical protein
MLRDAEKGGLVHRWKFGSTKPVGFSTENQPEGEK